MFELLISLFLIWFGFALRGWAESRREDRSIRSHFDALGMEIRYCGRLAGTYLDQNIASPLYRLPREAYHRAMPVLLQTGLVTGGQANVFQRFYLQVEQINRGLDNVDDYLRGKVPENEEQQITYRDEKARLEAKAAELRAQGQGNDSSELYIEAVSAFEAVFKSWRNRSWWNRIHRRWVRPLRERFAKGFRVDNAE